MNKQPIPRPVHRAGRQLVLFFWITVTAFLLIAVLFKMDAGENYTLQYVAIAVAFATIFSLAWRPAMAMAMIFWAVALVFGIGGFIYAAITPHAETIGYWSLYVYWTGAVSTALLAIIWSHEKTK